MSELKAYKNIQPVFNTDIQKDAVAADDYDGNEILFEESDEVYFKSEADKVIAEKDAEIQRLENLCESYRIDCDNLSIREANAYKEIERDNNRLRHHKYKRCLAMAKWCDEVMMSCELRGYAVHRMWANRHQWAMRWKYKWLAIAEKFKQESTAQ